MAPFRVIIVGGSISGLTLANALEKYGIDFVVLEKYEIAPDIGAGIAIWPYGARVLDQLGCHDSIVKLNEPVNTITTYDVNGNPRADISGVGDWFEDIFRYKFRFMERRECVQAIFDNLRDKSKVHAFTAVVKVECHLDGVSVVTDNGSVFHGDIVVGADGVRSSVRNEMQRLASDETPGRILFPTKESFHHTYRGLFGTSRMPNGLMRQDEVSRSFGKDRSYLAAGGPDGALYWIMFAKNDEPAQGTSFPHFTEAEAQELVTEYEDDFIRPGVTLGDIMKHKIKSALVPVEEGVLKTCFYRRMVLLGDSWHKSNPVTGLNGNSCINSAATLADELECFARRELNPDEARIERSFRAYQLSREQQARVAANLSHAMLRADALASPLHRIFQIYVVPHLPMEVFVNRIAYLMSLGVRLKHLPIPSRPGMHLYGDEVKLNPKPRPWAISLAWISLVVIATAWLYPLQKLELNGVPMPKEHRREEYLFMSIRTEQGQIYRLMDQMRISLVMLIMCIESYRRFFFMGILGSALLFGMLSLVLEWTIVISIYISLFILFTGAKEFYFPSPRALDLSIPRAIQMAYWSVYIPLFIYSLKSSALPVNAWIVAHAILPLVAQAYNKLLPSISVSSPNALFGKYSGNQLQFMGMVSAIHCVFTTLENRSPFHIFLLFMGKPEESFIQGIHAQTFLLDILIMIWISFVHWDLLRVHISTSFTWTQIISGPMLVIFMSPSMVLAETWKYREDSWEMARRANEDV